MEDPESNTGEMSEEEEAASLRDRESSRKRDFRADAPPAVARQNRLLYGNPSSTDLFEAEAPEINTQAAPVAPIRDVVRELNLHRLVQLLQGPPKELKISINEVGIRLPVIGWDLQPHALLCFVTGDVRCDLPRTNNVKIFLDNHPEITATFVGQWHQVPWLPFQVVAFGILQKECPV
jgi:hypothetical protein